MSTKKPTVPPTEQEIEIALDVISRSARARKESGELNAELIAFRKQNEKKRALAAECDATAQALYQPILDALPEEYHDLFLDYSILVIAPWSIRDSNTSMFRSINRKAKAFLAELEKNARTRRRSTSSH